MKEVLYRYREVLVTSVVLFGVLNDRMARRRGPSSVRTTEEVRSIHQVAYLTLKWNHAARSAYENFESTWMSGLTF